jgi:hypothetical protein
VRSTLSYAVIAAVLLMLSAHVAALLLSGADAASTPVSQLSRGPGAWLHSAGLVILAGAWALLAWLLYTSSSAGAFASGLWRLGCVLCALNAPMLLWIAAYFANASDARLFGPDANDPLAVLASSTGVAMAALQRGLRQRSVSLGRLNATVFVLWLGLVPVIPFITPDWLGAYERCVGSLLLLWMLLLVKGANESRTAD